VCRTAELLLWLELLCCQGIEVCKLGTYHHFTPCGPGHILWHGTTGSTANTQEGCVWGRKGKGGGVFLENYQYSYCGYVIVWWLRHGPLSFEKACEWKILSTSPYIHFPVWINSWHNGLTYTLLRLLCLSLALCCEDLLDLSLPRLAGCILVWANSVCCYHGVILQWQSYDSGSSL